MFANRVQGSDHCPVYAIIKDTIDVRGTVKHLKDIMSPQGMFENGERVKEYSEKSIPAFSGKLLKEFYKRRNIKDMFGKKPSMPQDTSSMDPAQIPERPQATATMPVDPGDAGITRLPPTDVPLNTVQDEHDTTSMPSQPGRTASPEKKRKASETTQKVAKKPKPATKAVADKSMTNGQQSLKGFFQSKAPKHSLPLVDVANDKDTNTQLNVESHESGKSRPLKWYGIFSTDRVLVNDQPATPVRMAPPTTSPYFLTPAKSPGSTISETVAESESPSKFVDPIVSKESWSKVFTKPTAPRCEHDEPCKTMKTKKTGFNCGREFWMCQR